MVRKDSVWNIGGCRAHHHGRKKLGNQNDVGIAPQVVGVRGCKEMMGHTQLSFGLCELFHHPLVVEEVELQYRERQS